MKIGILGGSFNPPHFGHLNVARTVKEKAGLNELRVIPSAKNPLKKKIDGPSAEERLDLTRIAFSDLGAGYVVDDREVKRGKTSYTIQTLEELKAEHPNDELSLVIGMDLLNELEEWKDWKKILDIANLVVCSRPGFELPRTQEDLPEFLQPLITDQDFNFFTLKSGKELQFLQLKDVEVSATDLRKWLRSGRSVEKYLPLGVELKIKNSGLYAPLKEKIGDYEEFAKFVANVLFERKAIGVRGFDLRPMTAPSEFAVICSATSTRHATALAEAVADAVKTEFNVYPQSLEGADEGRWVLVDYGSLIVHVFYDYIRQEYSLENLWAQGKDLKLQDPTLK
ncbi:MAG: nicotinate (nicotinamide) nucleotide adenylyltransferase [Bdellovibrionaceae bacterium]|nr:nicotinate (nicotinamide) nucleotide adenylyltransferase [Pseudobdellovibrionaceae bacterium]